MALNDKINDSLSEMNSRQETLNKQGKLMPMFDARLYRNLIPSWDGSHTYDDSRVSSRFYPFFDYGSYVSDWHETVASLDLAIMEAQRGLSNDSSKSNTIDGLKKRKDYIEKFVNDNIDQYLAPRSLVHPYALVKLAGASGSPQALAGMYTHDAYYKRKFYEIDGDSGYSGHYSKNPTTTALIKWGNDSDRGKTPYSFQDFVFCKWWNKIENNRLITLRRYAVPVTDNIEFSDYDTSETAGDPSTTGTLSMTEINQNGTQKTITKTGKKGTSPWTPLATAVTYFGKDTGNDLSKILSFSAKYNWKAIESDKSPIDISSSQNDAGANLVSDTYSGVSSGLGSIAKFMGILGEIKNGQTLNMDAATGVPPDPYKNGPYMNRILGPVNVITDTYRRERGLKFTHDGLSINFEYIARPIAGINNKAILMDLLANILVLGYSSGSWFGGMYRYRCENPAMYPWKYGDVMNKMHKGHIFGSEGAINTLAQNVYQDGKGLLNTFIPDAVNMLKGLFDGAVNAVKSMLGNNEENEQAREKSASSFQSALSSGTARTIEKLIAAKATKGTTIPYISGQRALLTGEPIGDWHLTIGNPFNPIAMIGNLVVTDLKIEFYDELGPDDFPIGFKATIKLNHGLGRDRDAIESMFNRGFGRIYTLSSEFRSSADAETKVDQYTGTGDAADGNRQQYEEIRHTYYGGGTRGIVDIQHTPLANKGSIYNGDVKKMPSLTSTNTAGKFTVSNYMVNPWQMALNM